MAEASSNSELKETFQKTVAKSQEYGKKIEQTFQKLGQPVKRNDNTIAKAMISEVEHMISNTDQGPVRDAALIVAANQQQMFRVASYGSLTHYAELIGKQDAATRCTDLVFGYDSLSITVRMPAVTAFDTISMIASSSRVLRAYRFRSPLHTLDARRALLPSRRSPRAYRQTVAPRCEGRFGPVKSGRYDSARSYRTGSSPRPLPCNRAHGSWHDSGVRSLACEPGQRTRGRQKGRVFPR